MIYLQDQDNSTNYIRYYVNSNSTITAYSYVTLSVTFLDGANNGLTNFGAGMNIFLSIFTNDIEIDTRFSNLEQKRRKLFNVVKINSQSQS